MRSVTYSLTLGLLAEVATSKTFKYTIPAGMKATEGCTLPGEFEISDLTIFTDNIDNTKNVTSFHFTDVDTGIDTFCQRNSTSKSASPGTAQRWPCDNANVEFIYQTAGIPGLTLIEKACPENQLQPPSAGSLRSHYARACLRKFNFKFEMHWQTIAYTGGLYQSLAGATLPVAPALPFASPLADQQTLEVLKGDLAPQGISVPFASSLERLSRLVDIAYCAGTTGIKWPFICASRCKDFPTLELITTWNTGVLLSDSCGYIAVDHSEPPGVESTIHMEQNIFTRSQTGGTIIVAFRGTYSITNTVVDLSTIPQKYVPYPAPEDGDTPPREPEHRCTNCTVHMGFLSSWRTARDDVLPTLKTLRRQYPDHPVYLIGHSLGGAVAALAALELKVVLGWENIVVTTFGEPRVGNEGFVNYLDAVFELNEGRKAAENQTYRRLTHVDDPVPLLPLSEWGYRSHAGEIFISKSELPPEPSDIHLCVGDYDPNCIAGSEGQTVRLVRQMIEEQDQNPDGSTLFSRTWGIPSRNKPWQLFFAHRDYFWRLGLCVPGGDPIDWGRDGYDDPRLNHEL
ncbi:hypothetical protein DL762_002230 [Monosporascus cannonballus]|uniref:Fungal lipase-type domain-containing protein n=1 Tax=Monosporascus cannonballus TaxID=155416 RepID=A0ABY0HGX9_9PEZI|nr:hypothetical protein DL762_002230 [Monosporascus cannonballus]